MTLRSLRESHHLTQRELGLMLNISSALVSKFEGAGCVAPRYEADYAKALGLAVGELPTMPANPRSARPVECSTCHREGDARDLAGRFLKTSDFCGLCGRPESDDAKRHAPLEGYIALANTSARHAAVGRRVEVFGDGE